MTTVCRVADISLQKIFQCNVVKEIMHHPVKLFPHGQRHTGVRFLTDFRVGLQAGGDGEGTFCQFEDFADGVFLWGACEPVAAALAAKTLEQLLPDKDL